MWKKDEEPSTQPSSESRTPSITAQRSSSAGGSRATIGPSISIKGDVTGSEDLLIQGQVDGSVSLGKHAVGVGSEGRVKANIIGRVITIEGRVEGDLTAEEQIVLRGSAQVHGDIKAPRVVLEDGATFRGLVDMGTTSTKAAADSRAEAKSGSEKASGSGSSGGSTSSSGSSSGGSSSGSSSSGGSSGSSGSSSGKGKESATATSRASA
ncbi:MAG: polymer-forming cytoskeletal protein [Gemmatimonadota bacterium]